MPDDRFEDSLRAIARRLSQSLSDTDLDEVAERLGVDRDRLQGAAGAVGGWLNDRASSDAPFFAEEPHADDPRIGHRVEPAGPSATGPQTAGPRAAGPHPLDLPTDEQGRALSALVSGRWALRPGSGVLTNHQGSAAMPAPPAHSDLTGDLRARDWITADGTVTLVGRQALLRWCGTVEGGDADPADDPAA